jgi:hypothetical protein
MSEMYPESKRSPEAALARLDAALEAPALARLIEEVRGNDFEVTRAYNRTYNRHNR